MDKIKPAGRHGYLAIGALLGGLLLAYSVVFTTLAPGGLWTNTIAGETAWRENDPGGYYLASAHELGTPHSSQVFAGHPGLPVQAALAGIQRALYLCRSARDLGYTEYVARHLGEVWWWSKLMSTVMHLVSLYCLFLLSRRLLGSSRSAMLATVAYGSSFPVLYYISRVSVEPWVLIWFCLAFLAILHLEDAMAQQGRAGAVGWAAIAAACAVSGAFTKMHLLAPLPVYCLAAILLGSPGLVGTAKPLARRRLVVGAAFVGVALVAALFYSQFMDWTEFLSYWLRESTPHLADVQAPVSWAGILRVRIQQAWAALSLELLRPAPVGIVEAPFVALACWGAAVLARRVRLRTPLVWPAAYAFATLALPFLRNQSRIWQGFHYLILGFAILAIAYGDLVARLVQRFRASRRSSVTLGALGLTIALHGGAIWIAMQSRIHDVHEYRRANIGALYEAIAELGRGERVLVVGAVPHHVHGLVSYASAEHPSRLVAEVEDILLYEDEVPDRQRRRRGFERRGVTEVVDARGQPARALSLDAWIRSRRSERQSGVDGGAERTEISHDGPAG